MQKILLITGQNGPKTITRDMPIRKSESFISASRRLAAIVNNLKAQGFRSLTARSGYPVKCQHCESIVDVADKPGLNMNCKSCNQTYEDIELNKALNLKNSKPLSLEESLY